MMASQRSSRRRRRRRAVRRWPFLLGTAFLLVLIVLAIAMADLPHRYLAERRDASATTRAGVWPSTTEVEAARPVYPHSIIEGGITSVDELREWIAADPVVAAHYRHFDLSRARLEPLAAPRVAHVSYRLNDRVYWTAKAVLIPAGELVITDGESVARVRCANQVADLPGDVSADEPDPAVLDTPLPLVPRGPSAMVPLMLHAPISQTPALEDAGRWNVRGTAGSGVFALDQAASAGGGFPPAVSSDARAIAPAIPVPVPQIPINPPGLPQPVPPGHPPAAPPPGPPSGPPPGVFPPGWPPSWPPLIPDPPGPPTPWHPDPPGGDPPDPPWPPPGDPDFPPTREVPEPGLTILLLGAMAAVLRRRRKRPSEQSFRG